MTPEERQRRAWMAWRRAQRRDAGVAFLFIACVLVVIFGLAVWLLPTI